MGRVKKTLILCSEEKYTWKYKNIARLWLLRCLNEVLLKQHTIFPQPDPFKPKTDFFTIETNTNTQLVWPYPVWRACSCQGGRRRLEQMKNRWCLRGDGGTSADMRALPRTRPISRTAARPPLDQHRWLHRCQGRGLKGDQEIWRSRAS